MTRAVYDFVHAHLIASLCSIISEGANLLSDWRKSGTGTSILRSGSVLPWTSISVCLKQSSQESTYVVGRQCNPSKQCLNSSLKCIISVHFQEGRIFFHRQKQMTSQNLTKAIVSSNSQIEYCDCSKFYMPISEVAISYLLIFVSVQPSSTTLFGVPFPLPTPQGRRDSQLRTMLERDIRILRKATPKTLRPLRQTC